MQRPRPAWPRRGTVAAVVVSALALGGCADDGEPRSDPTWTPTSVPESPSTTPADAPTRPALPEAAKKATPAGAEAFVHHYWEVANYAQATGDVKPLRALSAKDCEVCKGVYGDIRRHYARGGHVEGGVNVPRVDDLIEVESESTTLYAFQTKVTVKHGPQTVHKPDGTVSEREAGSNLFTMFVAWVDNARWQLGMLEVD